MRSQVSNYYGNLCQLCFQMFKITVILLYLHACILFPGVLWEHRRLHHSTFFPWVDCSNIPSFCCPRTLCWSNPLVLWRDHSADQITCSLLCPLVYGNIGRKREYQGFSGLVSLTVSVVSWNKPQKLWLIFCSSPAFRETQDTETVTATTHCFPPPSLSPD